MSYKYWGDDDKDDKGWDRDRWEDNGDDCWGRWGWDDKED